MPMSDSLAIFLHHGDRVEGIVHTTRPELLAEIDRFDLHALQPPRYAPHPTVELVSEGRAILTLAQLKGLLHTLEHAIAEGTVDAA